MKTTRRYANFCALALTSAGYNLEEAWTGSAALESAQCGAPDLVILDLGLPDMDGQVVLTRLREWLKAPVIILSARNQESQKVAALDGGADDYLTKPFGTAELLARIRAALRNRDVTASDTQSPVLEFENLKVDLAAHRVFVKGAEVHLTPIEYKLLSALVRSAGKVATHRRLLTEVWGPGQANDTHYLRVLWRACAKLKTTPHSRNICSPNKESAIVSRLIEPGTSSLRRDTDAGPNTCKPLTIISTAERRQCVWNSWPRLFSNSRLRTKLSRRRWDRPPFEHSLPNGSHWFARLLPRPI